MKRVLLLNASYNDERIILALRKLGCYIITTGNRPDLLGHKLADEYVFGDYTNMEEMLALAIEKKVDAVMPCVNDFGVKTAAYISEKLGFKGQDTYENVLIMHDKDRWKEFASKLGGINTPKAHSFDNENAAIKWAKNATEFPLISKAVDLSAGNGIRRANNVDELIDSIHESFKKSRQKKIVIEQFIEGTQHSFCAFLINKKVVAYCSNDEYSKINPYRVEVDMFPSDNYVIVKNDLIRQYELMAEALNLSDGIFSAQYIFSNGKTYILECMRRVLGGLYHIPAEYLGKGFDWEYWETKARCGFGVDDFPLDVPQSGFWAYRSLIAEENGVFKEILIPDEIKKHVFRVRYLHEPGYVIENFGSDPVGFLFFTFESKDKMHEIMVEHYSDIKVVTQ